MSREAVEVMRGRGVADARCGGLDEVSGERFDTVVLLMHGIGLVGTLGGLARFLGRIPTHLAEYGQIIFDSADLGLVTGLGTDDAFVIPVVGVDSPSPVHSPSIAERPPRRPFSCPVFGWATRPHSRTTSCRFRLLVTDGEAVRARHRRRRTVSRTIHG